MSDIASRPAGSMATGRLLTSLRSGLDRVYLVCGYLAATSMVGILLMTMLQIAARFTGYNFRGASDYAGYFMAASVFLAFPYALNEGSHIRIEVFLSFAGRFRFWIEGASFIISSFITVWFAFYAGKMVYWSYKLGDISQGMDATPIWIPQLTMFVGASLLAVAVIDRTLRLLFSGSHGLPASPDSL